MGQRVSQDDPSEAVLAAQTAPLDSGDAPESSTRTRSGARERESANILQRSTAKSRPASKKLSLPTKIDRSALRKRKSEVEVYEFADDGEDDEGEEAEEEVASPTVTRSAAPSSEKPKSMRPTRRSVAANKSPIGRPKSAKWTKTSDERLLSLLIDGTMETEIYAEFSDYTEGAIRERMTYLFNLHRQEKDEQEQADAEDEGENVARIDAKKGDPWAPEEVARLVELWDENFTMEVISKAFPGRSKSALEKRYRKAKKEKEAESKRAKRSAPEPVKAPPKKRARTSGPAETATTMPQAKATKSSEQVSPNKEPPTGKRGKGRSRKVNPPEPTQQSELAIEETGRVTRNRAAATPAADRNLPSDASRSKPKSSTKTKIAKKKPAPKEVIEDQDGTPHEPLVQVNPKQAGENQDEAEVGEEEEYGSSEDSGDEHDDDEGKLYIAGQKNTH
jgi:hypothetical protein